MEIPDIDTLIARQEKNYNIIFPAKFFKDMGGETVKETIYSTYGDYDVKVEEKILGVRVYKEGRAVILKVDDEGVFYDHNDTMFWDIFKNGKDKYRIKKDVPEGFTLTVKEYDYSFHYCLETDYYSVPLSYPFSNEEIEEKVNLIKRKMEDPKMNNKYFSELFPEGECHKTTNGQLSFKIEKEFKGVTYEVTFYKDFGKDLRISEYLWYKKEIMNSKASSGEVDDLIAHVQKNLKKLE